MEPHERVGADNTRNGYRAKTVLTEVGPVEVNVPRDRAGSFDPKLVRKRQRRLVGVDDLVVSLVAKGLTTGEVTAHLAEVYGAEVSRETISKITDRVLEGMVDWRNRPLDQVYPVVFLDAIVVKIRDGQVANRPIYVVVGVTVDGERDILGLWAGTGGEGAKFWDGVFTEVPNRGRARVCILVCDGLTGLPEAVTAAWPQTRRADIICWGGGSGRVPLVHRTGWGEPMQTRTREVHTQTTFPHPVAASIGERESCDEAPR